MLTYRLRAGMVPWCRIHIQRILPGAAVRCRVQPEDLIGMVRIYM
jgi:hypothetical protein